MSQPSFSLPSVAVVPPPFDVEAEVDDPLFQLLFNQSPLYVGVMEWLGDDARYLAVNPATAARLGRSADKIRGRSARALGLPAEACEAWGQLAAEATHLGAPARKEWQVSTEYGLASFRTTVAPLPSPRGSPPRFAYLTEDLSHVRALEQRLGGTESPSQSLAADVEQPLAYALHVLDVAGDEVETLAAIHPELEMGDAADALRDGIRNTRRAHQKLRDLLRG